MERTGSGTKLPALPLLLSRTGSGIGAQVPSPTPTKTPAIPNKPSLELNFEPFHDDHHHNNIDTPATPATPATPQAMASYDLRSSLVRRAPLLVSGTIGINWKQGMLAMLPLQIPSECPRSARGGFGGRNSASTSNIAGMLTNNINGTTSPQSHIQSPAPSQQCNLTKKWVEIRGGFILACKSEHERDDVQFMEALTIPASKLIRKSETVLQIQLPYQSLSAIGSMRGLLGNKKMKKITLEFSSNQQADMWYNAINQVINQRVVQLSDFDIISPIGKGGSGKVFLVRDKLTQEKLAMKVIQKYDVMESDAAIRHALDERFVLELVQGYPFILQMRHAFQTEQNLYLLCEFCSGGDLHSYLRSLEGYRMKEEEAKILAAEIVLALETLHAHGIVYRDLKPENLLISSDHHIVVADFGLAKILPGGQFGRTLSFCGTREYIAPEMVRGLDYGQKVDTWAMGVLLYRILAGYTPFYTPNQSKSELFRKIRYDDVEFSSRFSEQAKDLINKLLSKNEHSRLDIQQIKTHEFFTGIDWDKVYNKQYDWVFGERRMQRNSNSLNAMSNATAENASKEKDPNKASGNKGPLARAMAADGSVISSSDSTSEDLKHFDVAKISYLSVGESKNPYEFDWDKGGFLLNNLLFGSSNANGSTATTSSTIAGYSFSSSANTPRAPNSANDTSPKNKSPGITKRLVTPAISKV